MPMGHRASSHAFDSPQISYPCWAMQSNTERNLPYFIDHKMVRLVRAGNFTEVAALFVVYNFTKHRNFIHMFASNVIQLHRLWNFDDTVDSTLWFSL